MAELIEKEPLIGQKKKKDHANQRRLRRRSRSPGWGNGDAAESDLSENSSRASSMKSGKSECPTVQDLDAEIQNGPEPRDPDLVPNDKILHQYQEVPPQQRPPAVRLIVDNEEIMYPFKRGCCLDCCTRKLSNNRKKCSAVAFFFAILFLAGSIACLVLVTKYPEVLTDTTENITLHIPLKSAIKLNLTDYNISTIKRDKLKIAVANTTKKEHKGLITIATTHNREECTDENEITMTYKYKKGYKDFLRYWPSSSHVSVTISIRDNDDNHIIAWKWGTLSNPPPLDLKCEALNTHDKSTKTEINQSIFFNNKPRDMNYIRVILCNKADTETIANIEIKECIALPNDQLYKYIYIDDTKEPKPVEVQFQGFFSEMLKHSMLYIDTRHMSSSNNEADKEIQLELQNQTSSNPLKEIVIAITVILFIASILFFLLGCFCLCCCRRKEFCGCGVYYQNKRD
ncbi:PREDICTED: uncharacterized protein LOC109593458 [Amphimedon queenslandica]|nr:PREDICTED: uncharacterized protein LOC109593458 [Amphimedon queenslandica]|eukprot:XP_019864105.1 PREDICTED: uncharacterized protein LOC109593458 [Amphimedon queenslandica]